MLRSISDVVETKTGRGHKLRQGFERAAARGYGVVEVISPRRGYGLRSAGREVEARVVSYHLRDRPMADADNYRLQNELGWHDDCGNLLRFLDDPRIEPTNNRAERALRHAVIARKVSHCSKSVKGAEAFSTFHQRDQDVGAQRGRSACGGPALRRVQRRSRSLHVTLNTSPTPKPLINYR